MPGKRGKGKGARKHRGRGGGERQKVEAPKEKEIIGQIEGGDGSSYFRVKAPDYPQGIRAKFTRRLRVKKGDWVMVMLMDGDVSMSTKKGAPICEGVRKYTDTEVTQLIELGYIKSTGHIRSAKTATDKREEALLDLQRRQVGAQPMYEMPPSDSEDDDAGVTFEQEEKKVVEVDAGSASDTDSSDDEGLTAGIGASTKKADADSDDSDDSDDEVEFNPWGADKKKKVGKAKMKNFRNKTAQQRSKKRFIPTD